MLDREQQVAPDVAEVPGARRPRHYAGRTTRSAEARVADGGVVVDRTVSKGRRRDDALATTLARVVQTRASLAGGDDRTLGLGPPVGPHPTYATLARKAHPYYVRAGKLKEFGYGSIAQTSDALVPAKQGTDGNWRVGQKKATTLALLGTQSDIAQWLYAQRNHYIVNMTYEEDEQDNTDDYPIYVHVRVSRWVRNPQGRKGVRVLNPIHDSVDAGVKAAKSGLGADFGGMINDDVENAATIADASKSWFSWLRNKPPEPRPDTNTMEFEVNFGVDGIGTEVQTKQRHWGRQDQTPVGGVQIGTLSDLVGEKVGDAQKGVFKEYVRRNSRN